MVARDTTSRTCSGPAAGNTTTSTITDKTALLEVLDSVACMDLFTLARTIAPPPLNDRGRVDGRTRAGRRWHERTLELLMAAIDLRLAGLAGDVSDPDGTRLNEIGITDAGRRYLAEMRSL